MNSASLRENPTAIEPESWTDPNRSFFGPLLDRSRVQAEYSLGSLYVHTCLIHLRLIDQYIGLRHMNAGVWITLVFIAPIIFYASALEGQIRAPRTNEVVQLLHELLLNAILVRIICPSASLSSMKFSFGVLLVHVLFSILMAVLRWGRLLLR